MACVFHEGYAMKRALGQTWLWITVILLVAAGLKIGLLIADVVPFNADEAVVALMARHILQGELPIFFYGQAYMGSLDGWLVAAGFAVFGQEVWVIRLIQGLLYLGVILTTVSIAQVGLRSTRIGLLAAALLAVPTVNVTLYTTASLGGYGEALLIGNLLLLLAFSLERWAESRSGTFSRLIVGWAVWGWLAGLGLWANALTLVYSAPAGLFLLWSWRKWSGWRKGWFVWPILAVGFWLGALPWWLFALQNGAGALVSELMGSAVAVEQELWILRSLKHLFSFLLLGGTVIFGMRPPWSVDWLALPFLPLALVAWAVVLISALPALRRRAEEFAFTRTLAGVCVTLVAGFVFTSFGVDPSGRYFLPMAVPLALAAGYALEKIAREASWKQAGFLLVILLGFHLWGTLQVANRYPPGLTTQFYKPSMVDHRAMGELISFLEEHGEQRGYSNYWVAYPLAFQSQETLIFVPRLPYHTDLRYTVRDDRYAPYGELVAQSERVA
jgi:4-amino-4-deoxy-L-arabinose transferase-like glycosyltransferase